MIGIVDYGAGNLLSVAKAFEFLNFDVKIIQKASDFQKVSKVIIPGVGSFGNAMKNINNSGFVEPVLNWNSKGDPLLGICLGMQILLDSSEESPGVRGLGLIPGFSRKFKNGKVPNIGWLETFSAKKDKKRFFYFLHSYFVIPEDSSVVTSTAVYGETFAASIENENLCGVQFHPEKSGEDGLKILKEWGHKK